MAHPLHRERREELRLVTPEVIGERLHHRDEVGAKVACVGHVVCDDAAVADRFDDQLCLRAVAPVDRGLADTRAGRDALDAHPGIAGSANASSVAVEDRLVTGGVTGPTRGAARLRPAPRRRSASSGHPHGHRLELGAEALTSTSSASAGRQEDAARRRQRAA